MSPSSIQAVVLTLLGIACAQTASAGVITFDIENSSKTVYDTQTGTITNSQIPNYQVTVDLDLANLMHVFNGTGSNDAYSIRQSIAYIPVEIHDHLFDEFSTYYDFSSPYHYADTYARYYITSIDFFDPLQTDVTSFYFEMYQREQDNAQIAGVYENFFRSTRLTTSSTVATLDPSLFHGVLDETKVSRGIEAALAGDVSTSISTSLSRTRYIPDVNGGGVQTGQAVDYFGRVAPIPVVEPGTLALLCTGAVGLGLALGTRRRAVTADGICRA